MIKYNEKELQLLNIQIGCVLRLARLKQELSQLTLSLMLNSNPTMVGRVERFENVSSWDKIYIISQLLDIDFCELFVLKSKDRLLSILEESINLEDKLTKEKRNYYSSLKSKIINEYDSL
ncbi:hypothetical protein DFQ09_10194 [Winogradskyella pacifica]|uniref:HTH cro/C1-type domain-containing protein n=1 Tax=Winogradskyella pacifica TaxID=664642 RepID=A0A3D9N745_9FLAO|nr:XRE family transcriptional regulator [Winogradskyella pacifica]REE27266.1 hypothetical protein DFQ09_10194 [Winogradskyella pacifica]